MQVQTIKIENYKAISELEINLQGHSAYLIGANGSGKTTVGNLVATLLLPKMRPGTPLKQGETAGFAEATVSDGHVIRWRFDEASDTLEIIDPTGKAVSQRSVSAILKRLAGAGMEFDINEFLALQPKPQKEYMARLIGLDLSGWELRYKIAYDQRTDANRARDGQAARVQPFDTALLATPRVDVGAMAAKIEEAHAHNRKIQDVHAKLETRKAEHSAAAAAVAELETQFENTESPYQPMFLKAVQGALKSNPVSRMHQHSNALLNAILEDERVYYAEHDAVSRKLDFARQDIKNAAAAVATGTDYIATKLPAPIADGVIAGYRDQIAKAETTNAAIDAAHRMHQEAQTLAVYQEQAAAADATVKTLEAERVELLKSKPLPAEGLTFGDEGLLLNGLPFTDQQICTSAKMIAAAQIALSMLGDVKYLHFDASILDKPNADRLLAWAEANGLQLALERVSWESEELHYQIVGAE